MLFKFPVFGNIWWFLQSRLLADGSTTDYTYVKALKTTPKQLTSYFPLVVRAICLSLFTECSSIAEMLLDVPPSKL